MPIKPENRARYPANWREIRAAIMERAGSRCEHRDGAAHRCRAAHRTLGYWQFGDLCRLPVGFERLQRQVWQWVPLPNALVDAGIDRPCTIETAEGPLKIVEIVLTIAHLDHVPEHCDPANLRAWCQRHHLAYDAEHHRGTAQATRRARSGNRELFDA